MDYKKKVAVIGAGPAGMTCAYQLSKDKNCEISLFEASSSVGGLAKTITLWNQKVDIGPHRFFSSDKKVNEFWLEVVGDKYEMVNRLTRVFYNDKFFYYPLKPADAFLKLGLVETFRCILSYLKEKIYPIRLQGDFETWITSRFGRRLYQIFFKTYSEKLWGIKCTELDADFASQRIKNLSLLEAIRNAFFGGNKHKTLVDQFAYPTGGSGMVYELMRKKFEENGGALHLNAGVHKVLVKNKQVTGLVLESGEEILFDHVVSSMPLTLLVSRLDEVPAYIKEKAGALRFRNTILVYLNVNKPDLFEDNWLYIHSDSLQLGRVTNFRNWVPQLYGNENTSILCLEFWCFEEDEMWRFSDERLIELAKKELNQADLDRGAEITGAKVHRINRCYPVYSRGYKQILEPIESYLKGIENLIPIGRYGAFKYNNQDHSILMGLLAAENISQGAAHDLWSVNTDYDDYQESSVITKTGLQKQEIRPLNFTGSGELFGKD